MRGAITIFATTAIVSFAGIGQGHAAQILANDDCYVDNGVCKDNLGIIVKTVNNRNGWIEFTLGSTAVGSATLRLYENNDDPSNTTVNVRGATYNFNEGTFTGTDTTSWTDLGTLNVNISQTWYTVDITSFYNSHLGQTVTFHLKPITSPGNSATFEDREGSLLSVNYPRIEWTPSNVPPIIQEVSPDPDGGQVNVPYTRQLVLTQGTLPVTWSVVQGPTGLTVDSSGRVSGWTPASGDMGQTFTIEIRATNSFGSDTESWQVLVQTVQAPVIQEVSPDPDQAYVGTPYSKQLSLSQGTGVTWSVDQGPTGLTVNSSGLVSGWTPTSVEIGQIYGITIRATTVAGYDTESWNVIVSGTTGIVFPGAAWQFKTPAELGLDGSKLDQVAGNIGGVGCIARQGYMVKTWGDQASKGDWASAAKPVVTTMLLFAVKEGIVSSVNKKIRDYGWALNTKDQPMEFYHLANMTSGYARGEAPGAAYAYNDYAINLYVKTLFDRAYGTTADAAARNANRLGFLQLQDGTLFSSRGGYGVYTTPRDFARIGWLWLNKGNWNGTQLLPTQYFDDYMKAHVPITLPRTTTSGTDYLGVGTYGGGSDQNATGPGIYGFNWWFQGYDVTSPTVLTWPDGPSGMFVASGHGGNECVVVIPSLYLIMAYRSTCANIPGDVNCCLNQAIKLLVQACPPLNPNPPVAVIEAEPTFGQAPLTVSFDGSGSYDVEGPIAKYEWDFDNNGTIDANGVTVNHPYAAAGVYTAKLIVTDGAGLTDDATVEITVNAAPTGSIVVDPNHPAWFKYEGGGPFFTCGPGDPEDFLYRGTRLANGTRSGDQMTLINKVVGTGANCIYMQIVRSHGGDGDSSHNPFVDSNINNPLDQDILNQWETWFTAMDSAGITIFLIFYDDGAQPFGRELIGGQLDSREAYLIDTIVGAFKHHRHLIWCVAEEYGEALSTAHVSKVAERIKQQDTNHHPVAVHQNSGTSFDFNGNPNLDQFAVQYNTSSKTDLHNAAVAAWNNMGGLKNVNLAEFQPMPTGSDLRQKVWAIAMGGAYSMILFMDIASTPVSDLQICGRLVQFMEGTRFNETAPADSLARGNTDYVLANPGQVYFAYGDSGSSLGVNVQAGSYRVKWFDPADGDWVDQGVQTFPGGDQTFTKPGAIGSEAVVYLVQEDAPPVMKTLTLTETNEGWGEVLISPEPNDPQNVQFLQGTVVTLTAVPAENKEFRQWQIMDPNYPGDANFATIDANMMLTIVLNEDTHVDAVWKCGSQSGLIPMMACCALTWVVRRHGRQGGR